MRLIFNLFLGWWLTQYYRWMAEGKPLPRPSISVNPSNMVALGENISISCKKERTPEGTSTFYLYKAMSNERMIRNTMHNEVEFHIFNVQPSHQGKYSCLYEFNSVWSSYSNTVFIFVRDQFYPSPSISIIPNGMIVLGKKATIQCKQEYYPTAYYNLFKKEALDAPANHVSNKQIAEFLIPSVQESDGGIYFCDYQIYWNKYSKFSNKIYINITDPKVTEPAIFMEPKGQQMLDTDVRIYCQGPKGDLKYFLYKSTDLIASQKTKPNSSLAEFSILGVRLEHIGNYSCCYQLKNKPFMYSKLSDPLQLEIRDPSLTKPSIQIINEEQDAPEAIVSIQCKATETDLIFALLKSGKQLDCKVAEPGEKAVNFSHHWIKLEEIQNYTCQYKTMPFVWSVPSDPAERPWEGKPLITLWTSIAACLFFLTVLLLVLILILFRKRKKGSAATESNVPAKMVNCCKLRTTCISNKGTSSQEICLRPSFSKEAMKTLEKSHSGQDVSISVKHLNFPMEETPDEVSYATINHNSLKILYDTAPESCVYANVSPKSTKEI